MSSTILFTLTRKASRNTYLNRLRRCPRPSGNTRIARKVVHRERKGASIFGGMASVSQVLHIGQANNAMSATRLSSARMAPPAAWTGMPWETVATNRARSLGSVFIRDGHLTPRRIDSSRKTADLGLNFPEAVPFVVGVHVDQSFFHGGRGPARLDGNDALARLADRVFVIGRQWRYAGDATLRAGPRTSEDVVGEVSVGHSLGVSVLAEVGHQAVQHLRHVVTSGITMCPRY